MLLYGPSWISTSMVYPELLMTMTMGLTLYLTMVEIS